MAWQLLPEFPPNTRAGNVCSICGSDLRQFRTGGHERALDTGIWIDAEGRFVICESCVIEAADLLGMIHAGTAHALRANILRVEHENRELKAGLDTANRLLKGLASYAEGQHDQGGTGGGQTE